MERLHRVHAGERDSASSLLPARLSHPPLEALPVVDYELRIDEFARPGLVVTRIEREGATIARVMLERTRMRRSETCRGIPRRMREELGKKGFEGNGEMIRR
jgi:hypothetical protein